MNKDRRQKITEIHAKLTELQEQLTELMEEESNALITFRKVCRMAPVVRKCRRISTSWMMP